jgi:carotenoid cleavage dioxygenase-like enzyme
LGATHEQTSSTNGRNPFWLTGNYAPVKDETTAYDLKVTGSIPPELDGRYFKTGAVLEQQLDDANIDFPRVPDSLVGKPYRYGYTAEFEGGEPINPQCVAYHKYDLRSGSKTTHRFKNGRRGAEAVFVPAANGSLEDDGYLLSYVYDPADQKSELVILDASQIENEPLARIHLPTRVPVGFHGSWIPNPA